MDALPISRHTAKIIATETMFTVSKKADMILDLRSLSIYGFSTATNKNEGRKIPIVAAIAPGKPAICQPMKVADEKRDQV